MANMELTPAESKEEGKEEGKEMAEYRPRFAVSEMYLDEHALKALGLAEPLQPGQIVAVTGAAKIVSASAREDADGKTENCMSLQLTDLDLRPVARDARKAFPNSKMEE